MLMSFAGSFLSCFLLGEPIISPLKQHNDVILGSIVWYLIFYSPFDIVFKLSNWFPIKVILSVLKEIQRTHKIASGVKHAGRIYPESYLVQILVGVAKGAGSGVVKIVEQLARGTWIPTNHEILRPSFTTKACVIASLVFTLERHSMYVTAPHDLVYLVSSSPKIEIQNYFVFSAWLVSSSTSNLHRSAYPFMTFSFQLRMFSVQFSWAELSMPLQSQ